MPLTGSFGEGLVFLRMGAFGVLSPSASSLSDLVVRKIIVLMELVSKDRLMIDYSWFGKT